MAIHTIGVSGMSWLGFAYANKYWSPVVRHIAATCPTPSGLAGLIGLGLVVMHTRPGNTSAHVVFG